MWQTPPSPHGPSLHPPGGSFASKPHGLAPDVKDLQLVVLRRQGQPRRGKRGERHRRGGGAGSGEEVQGIHLGARPLLCVAPLPVVGRVSQCSARLRTSKNRREWLHVHNA